MVCLGPRKKKTVEERGVKKTSRLKPPGTTATTKPGTARASVDSQLPKSNNPRASVLSNKKGTAATKTAASRPTSVASVKPPPKTRPSIASIRATAATAVKNTAAKATKSTTRKTATTTANAANNNNNNNNNNTTAEKATVKRFPISEMKEEVKELKAKNEESLKLIADQKAELELLKKQLIENKDHETTQEELSLKEKEIEELKVKQQELSSRETEIDELRIKYEKLNTPVEELAEKQRLLNEKEAELEEQRKLFDEKSPEIDQVASQLEELKTLNLDAVNQLADKEKELEELRSLINNNPKVEKEEDKEKALQKIEELNKQLEAQKKSHEESLRLHETALAEKDSLLKEQQLAIESLEGNHIEEMRSLKTAQTSSILALKKKHKDDKIQLEEQLEEVRKEAKKNPAEEVINDHLEKMLQEFEQQEHTFAVQIEHLENEHQSAVHNLQDNQINQMNKLRKNHGQNRETWTERYLPKEAVSWPSPTQQPKLRPTPTLVESKSKTLLKVLGNLSDFQSPEPILTPLDPKKVQIYYSSVSSNSGVKKNQEQIKQLLESNNIKFGLIDVASSETARQYAKRANNNGRSDGRIKDFPQLFVGGEYRGQLNDLIEAIDGETLDDLLHPAKERHFTEEEKSYIRKAEMNEELGQHKMLPPPIPTVLPKLKPVKQIKKVQPLKDYDEDEELLRMIELEMKEGKELDLDNL